jgi:MFS family permease
LTFGFLPILARTIGASNSQVAFIATFFFIFFLAGSFLTTSISKSVNLNMLVMSGFFSLIIGLSLAAFSVNVAMIFASQAFVGLAIGVCEPLLMGLSIKSLPVEDQSNAMGFHQTIYAIGMFSGPFISGLLANYFGIKPMIIFNLVFTLVILIIFYGKYFVSHPSKEKEFA